MWRQIDAATYTISRISTAFHTNAREHSGGYESDGSRRNGSRLFPAQCFEFLKVGGDFPFSVELVIVIETKITERVARLKDSVDDNQHGMRYGDIGALFPAVYLYACKLRGKEGIFALDCSVGAVDQGRAEHGIAFTGPAAFSLASALVVTWT